MTVFTPAERKIAQHQGLALQTWASKGLPELEQLTHATMGLAGEVAEAQGMVAEAKADGQTGLGQDFLIELGDVYYYLQICLHLVGGTLADLADLLFDDLPVESMAVTQGMDPHMAHQALAIYYDITGTTMDQQTDAQAYFTLGMGHGAGQAMSIVTKARYKPGRVIDKGQILAHLATVYRFLLLAADDFEHDIVALGDLVFAKLYHGHGWTEGRQGANND